MGQGVKRIRGGSGLGDAIYLRPIVEHFLRAGERVQVCSNYPDVFCGLDIQVETFNRNNIDVLAHYTAGKLTAGMNQWQDICASAKVSVPLSFEWTVRNLALVDGLRAEAAGRPIIVVHAGRVPMARTDGFGKELLPERAAVDAVLEELADCLIVQIGKDGQQYTLKTEVDLSGRTSITDIFDLAVSVDGFVGQCSFIIPLAEAFDKPLLVVWAAAGMSPARHYYIRAITPRKVLSKQSSRFVVDDWAIGKIQEEARAFRDF